MPSGVYERKRSTRTCTVCGKEYSGCDNAKYCPDCRKDLQAGYKSASYQRKKDKLHAFRRSIGLE